MLFIYFFYVCVFIGGCWFIRGARGAWISRGQGRCKWWYNGPSVNNELGGLKHSLFCLNVSVSLLARQLPKGFQSFQSVHLSAVLEYYCPFTLGGHLCPISIFIYVIWILFELTHVFVLLTCLHWAGLVSQGVRGSPGLTGPCGKPGPQVLFFVYIYIYMNTRVWKKQTDKHAGLFLIL